MRKPLPEAIANAPDLLPGLELYYVAFMDLSSSRALGMGEGPIGWAVIDQYARSNEFNSEQRDDLFFHLGKMDTAYLDYRSDQLKAKSPKKK